MPISVHGPPSQQTCFAFRQRQLLATRVPTIVLRGDSNSNHAKQAFETVAEI